MSIFSTNASSGKRFRRIRLVFFWIRVMGMLVLMAAAAQLVMWNRDYDPRFYQFLSTAPGQALSRVMQWPNLYNRQLSDKALEEYTDEERVWRQKLLKQLSQSWPTHTLELKNGTIKHVRFMEVNTRYVSVREHFGGQGELDTRIFRSDIAEIEPFTDPQPTVTWRDVRFQMEYPDFHLTYSGHYTVLSDAPYYQISSSVEALEDLRGTYLDLFTPLVRFPKPEQGLQVLFFSKESQYREHQSRSAPALADSVGYYSPLEDRLVVFNHQFSEQTTENRRQVAEEVRELLSQPRSEAERQHILHLQQRIEDEIRKHARQETLSTLRHEGAHHLSYTYGVHSWIHAENAWIIEGLAGYFESPIPSKPTPSHLLSLLALDKDRRIPELAQLMAIRKPESFEAELPGLKAYEAYALSWSLFHFCMQEDYRTNFFTFLRELQAPASIRSLMGTARIEHLAEALELSPSELDTKWRHHIRRLLAASA